MKSVNFKIPVVIVLLTLALSVSAHAQGGPESDCQLCHMEQGWSELRTPLLFDHSSTSFPLEGEHRTADCRSCHTGATFEQIHDFTSATTSCAGCHEDIHRGELGADCSECHTPDGWNDRATQRRLHDQTRLPLVGVHAGLDCDACHASGRYAGVSPECISCHLESWLATRNPDHQATGFSTDCQSCHGLATTTWDENTSGYNQIHPFPLVGGHDNLDCSRCHLPGSNFSDLTSECFACHEADFRSTNDPDHVASGFGTQCDVCHTVYRWSDATFNHDATGFPLTGAHDGLECVSCHADGYVGLSSECASCHQSDFDNATEPVHESGSFGLDCMSCHNTSLWTPSTFDHTVFSGYALTGAHAEETCSSCHANGQYSGTSNICSDCHLADFDGATEPIHESGSFTLDCKSCHNTTAWSPGTFDHQIFTGYALTGAHVEELCVSCHANGQYSGTPTICLDCHTADFEGAVDPPHDPTAFGTNCEDCHTTEAWTPASFDHLTVTGFALTGAHSSAACTGCHFNGNYTSTPTTCYGCHQQEYESTNDPDHVAAGFPTNCEECHSTSNWDDATFDHDNQWFPIYSGEHRGTWDSCADCHPNSSAYSEFTCISCHEHNQTSMNNEHDDVSNYRYESSACYDCHPQGRADDDDSISIPPSGKWRKI